MTTSGRNSCRRSRHKATGMVAARLVIIGEHAGTRAGKICWYLTGVNVYMQHSSSTLSCFQISLLLAELACQGNVTKGRLRVVYLNCYPGGALENL